MTPPPPPSRLAIALAFAAVYVVWGSTYLAMRIGVGSLPPFLLGAIRFFLAGCAMWGYHAAKGKTHLARGHWRNTTIAGLLLLVGGNGGVVWAVQHIPSGLAALIVGTVPLWVVALAWATGARRPSGRLVSGLALGLVGIAVLLGPDVVTAFAHDQAPGTPARAHALGVLAVLFASLSWAVGSLWSRRARVPEAPLLPTGMQMLAGGAALFLLSAVRGEMTTFSTAQVTSAALLALAYLVVFGSLLAYSAYIWLLQVVPPARVATYAFVNPVVAVFLGTALAGEPLGTRTLVSAAIIVAAVALITTAPADAPPQTR